MKKMFVLALLSCVFADVVSAEDKAFEPVKLEVGGLSYDFKKQEESQINNDVFEFKKWYVEPFEMQNNELKKTEK